MMEDRTKFTETLPVAIKKMHLWRREIDASPAMLAEALQPLADAGIRLQVSMRYKHFRDEKRAVIEVCPHESEDESRCASVMHAAGYKVSNVPVLLIEGEGAEAPGIEYAIAKIIAEQELNVMFFVTQSVNGAWGALMGFVSEEDAEKAAIALLLRKIEIPEGEQSKAKN